MKLLDARDFGRLKVADPNYYTGRWPYLQVAARMASEVAPETVLELGPYRRPLYLGCDVMDIHDYARDGTIRWLWDAKKAPWPASDKSYDLFVALQVWEHLGNDQAQAFREVQRISRCAILSFPLEWSTSDPSDCHHGITTERISEWTDDSAPDEVVIVTRPNPAFKRMVALYRFDS